ncbi:epimerase [Pseudooceanicola sp. LIPI14-2-Ac024]|uniref:epimerase n=1 Tax=Pseudooceanicola sp. LIPI14-2-Ac024 TaxID=3344875 RepID=UPI0035CF68F9
MTRQQTVLVTGANGKFGRHAAQAFAAAGWSVRRFDRKTQDLTEAATGADAIVMGMHPPTYDLWADQLLPLHQTAVDAARAHDIPVIVPGNLYGFGPGAGAMFGPDAPQTATNPLGHLRRRMEALYRDSGARTIMLYCGDFLDDRASGNWFDRFIAKDAWKGRIAYPGDLDTPHAWCWLPDAGRIAVALADRRDSLARFEQVPVPGYTLSGRQMAEALARVTGAPVRAGQFPWWQLQLARPFLPVLRGVFEMRYLWSLPHRLDPAPLDRLLPDFVPTPLDQAMAKAAAALPKARSSASRRDFAAA